MKYRVVPYRENPNVDAWAIGFGLEQVEWVKQVRPVASAVVMEVGSGWQPLIPAVFSLAGASKVYLTDLNKLLTEGSLKATLHSLRTNRAKILKSLGIPDSDFEAMVKWPGSVEKCLKQLRLEYLAPCDCRSLPGLASGSVDVIVSNSVLEHIPGEVLQAIHIESHRLLSPDGVACHFVDTSDHWEHQDRSITKVNFLQFSDASFRWTYLNDLHYQNRLRYSDYLKMLPVAGLEAVREEHVVDPLCLKDLERLQLDKRFQGFEANDLATTRFRLLLRAKFG